MWRGIGEITASGYGVEYSDFDATKKYDVSIEEAPKILGISGQIMKEYH